MARKAPSSTLTRDARDRRREQAQKRPSAPPLAAQPGSDRMNTTSAATGPAEHLRVGAHRRDNPRAHPRAEAAERRRGRSGREAERTSERRNRRPRPASRRGRPRPRQRPRARSPAAADAPRAGSRCVSKPARATDGEKPRVLPGAVVLDRRRVGACLEVGLGRGGRGEQRADRIELLGRCPVRGARDRDLAVVEIGPRADERQRLERLRRRSAGT